MIKTDHREILNKSPKGSRTDDMKFKAMRLEIKDKIKKPHKSLESKGK